MHLFIALFDSFAPCSSIANCFAFDAPRIVFVDSMNDEDDDDDNDEEDDADDADTPCVTEDDAADHGDDADMAFM